MPFTGSPAAPSILPTSASMVAALALAGRHAGPRMCHSTRPPQPIRSAGSEKGERHRAANGQEFAWADDGHARPPRMAGNWIAWRSSNSTLRHAGAQQCWHATVYALLSGS
jgi:hypothetical protein